MSDKFLLNGQETQEPHLYRGCGLDGIYLLNGYTLSEHGGEQCETIEGIHGLHWAIARHLVVTRKSLSGKEIRFIRKTMRKTQEEFASELEKSGQTVARWEKGESIIEPAEEKLLRFIFLFDYCQDRDHVILKDEVALMREAIKMDEPHISGTQFEFVEGWRLNAKQSRAESFVK